MASSLCISPATLIIYHVHTSLFRRFTTLMPEVCEAIRLVKSGRNVPHQARAPH
jgi:hypothetical protein